MTNNYIYNVFCFNFKALSTNLQKSFIKSSQTQQDDAEDDEEVDYEEASDKDADL